MKKSNIVAGILALSLIPAQAFAWGTKEQEEKDREAVARQQAQYAIGQPIPFYDWSLERELVIKLYNLRNQKVATHSVWRDYGVIENDCPSMGFGIPYDTSLTNPFSATSQDEKSWTREALASIGQAEPNGVFASTNTSATWVMCIGEGGVLEPIYTELKVSVYPYAVEVDYATGRVQKAGGPSVILEGVTAE